MTETKGRDVRLAELFVRLADSLVTEFDVIELLDELVASCVELLDASAAGLMLADQRGQLRVMAASTEQARLLELFEIQNEDGPCLDCYRTSRPLIAITDDEQAALWPRFARELRAGGFGPVYAMPLRLRDNTIGALNLFLLPGAALSPSDVALAQALADVATIAILQHRAIHAGQQLAEQLQTALNSRVAIEQAKGVVAERAGVDMDQAFDLLRSYARQSRSRLSDVATGVASGRLRPESITERDPTADVAIPE
jgi:GAF domain-containing protein